MVNEWSQILPHIGDYLALQDTAEWILKQQEVVDANTKVFLHNPHTGARVGPHSVQRFADYREPDSFWHRSSMHFNAMSQSFPTTCLFLSVLAGTTSQPSPQRPAQPPVRFTEHKSDAPLFHMDTRHQTPSSSDTHTNTPFRSTRNGAVVKAVYGQWEERGFPVDPSQRHQGLIQLLQDNLAVSPERM